MKSIATILIDDEPRGLNSLQKLLQLHCSNVEVICTCNNVKEAAEKIELLQPQLVFLDIAMPEKNGFDLLKSLPKINFEIIFVTAHSNYMLQAFHFSAVDYLLKPVDDDLLIEAVTRAARRIAEKAPGYQVETFLHNLQQKGSVQKLKLCIPSLKGFQVVEISEIIYCEANTNYTNFYFASGTSICSSKAIHEYEDMLSDSNFIRIHRSFMVNLAHVKEYIRGEGGSVILSGGHEIEVSRRRKDVLLAKIRAYYKF